jgi:HlyD family secretion protein
VQARVVASLSPTLFSSGPGIVSLRARAGAQVRAGETLAIIDSPELRSALDQARAELMTSRAELDRQVIASRQAHLRAQQQVDLLTVRLQAAERQQERMDRMFSEGLGSKTDNEAARDAARIALARARAGAQGARVLAGERGVRGDDAAPAGRAAGVHREGAAEARGRPHHPRALRRMVAAVSVQDRDAP